MIPPLENHHLQGEIMAFQALQVLQASEGAWMSASRIDSGCVAVQVNPPGIGECLVTEQTGLLYLGTVPFQNVREERSKKEEDFYG